MAKILNAFGTEIDFEAVVVLMDDDLRDELHATGSYETEETFFSAYAAAHEARFGVAFEPAKKNPVW